MSFVREIQGVRLYFDFSDWGSHGTDGIRAAKIAADITEGLRPEIVQQAHSLMLQMEDSDTFSEMVMSQPENPEFYPFWMLHKVAQVARSICIPEDADTRQKAFYAHISLPPEA